MSPRLTFAVPFCPIHSAFPSSCLYRVKGTGGRSLSTCCGCTVFCEAPGLNTSAHCANSPQSLVFPVSEGPPLCGGPLWPSEGYGAAKRRGRAGKKSSAAHCCIQWEYAKDTLALLADIMAECWKETVKEWRRGTKASKVAAINRQARSHARKSHTGLCLTAVLFGDDGFKWILPCFECDWGGRMGDINVQWVQHALRHVTFWRLKNNE